MRLASALLVVLLLGGCTAAPTLPPVDWNRVKIERQALDHWEMTGRAAVATATDGWTAAITWRQRATDSELRLQGALGVGGVRVLSDGRTFEIETSKGENITAEDAEAALERAIGVPLPVRYLRFWLLGVPAPQTDAVEELDDQGRLSTLEQDGWKAMYDRYVYLNDAWLPGRVRLENGPLRMRVVVDEWRF
jgi:outer membrane lipoprotein LolB